MTSRTVTRLPSSAVVSNTSNSLEWTGRDWATAGRGKSAHDNPHAISHVLPLQPALIPALQPKLRIGSTNDPREAEADAIAEQVVGGFQSLGRTGSKEGPSLSRLTATSDTPTEAPPIVHETLRTAGQPLDASARGYMESRFDADFSRVRIHTDTRASESARAVNALAYTVGTDVVFGAGQYNPRSGEGSRLLAHELAHTMQQGGNMLRRVPTTLSAYPEAERHSIQQSTIPTPMIDAPFLMSVFGTAAQNGGAATSYSFGGQTVFDTSIPATLQRGLTSVGAYLSGQTNVLPLGSTVTVHLDLTPFTGPDASFRFSYFTHTENRTSGEYLLIENVGGAPAVIAPAASVPSGQFTAGGQSFTAGGGWSPAQFGSLQAVLARLPANVLVEAAGTTFSLRGQGTADEAGHYDSEHDEIVIHQNAFPATATTFGGADHSMYAITHEIGHLLDLRRLQRAWTTFDSGGQTPAGQRTLLGERSLSGERWTLPAGQDFTQVDARTEVRGTAFRQAAQQDGVHPGGTAADPLSGGPTSYSNTDWQELFAESFALYVNDPTLFQTIRPHLYQYFSTRFPLPSQSATPATQAGGQTSGQSSP